jgi:hypothetical protein
MVLVFVSRASTPLLVSFDAVQPPERGRGTCEATSMPKLVQRRRKAERMEYMLTLHELPPSLL